MLTKDSTQNNGKVLHRNLLLMQQNGSYQPLSFQETALKKQKILSKLPVVHETYSLLLVLSSSKHRMQNQVIYLTNSHLYG